MTAIQNATIKITISIKRILLETIQRTQELYNCMVDNLTSIPVQ